MREVFLKIRQSDSPRPAQTSREILAEWQKELGSNWASLSPWEDLSRFQAHQEGDSPWEFSSVKQGLDFWKAWVAALDDNPLDQQAWPEPVEMMKGFKTFEALVKEVLYSEGLPGLKEKVVSPMMVFLEEMLFTQIMIDVINQKKHHLLEYELKVAYENNELFEKIQRASRASLMESLLGVNADLSAWVSQETKIAIGFFQSLEAENFKALKNTSNDPRLSQFVTASQLFWSGVLNAKDWSVSALGGSARTVFDREVEEARQKELEKALIERDPMVLGLLASLEKSLAEEVSASWWGRPEWWDMLGLMMEDWRWHQQKA